MKKRLKVMLWLLVVPAVLLTAVGIYLKYWVLEADSRYRDHAAAALPLILVEDRELQEHLADLHTDSLELGLPQAMPVQPVLPEPTEPPTEPPETEPPETVPETIPPFTWEFGVDEEGRNQFVFSGPKVDDPWFENVLFIGDSRTVMLRDLVRSGNADYFCAVGLSVFTVQNKVCEDRSFGQQWLNGVLDGKQYDKIFINLGLNEAGSGRDAILAKYRELIALIQEKQPDAKIILQSIMTLSYTKASSQWYFGLSNLAKINEGIASLADGERIYCIDVNEIFADENGYLRSGLSGDGCHLYGKYGVVWEDWIRHAVAQLDIE